MVKIDRDFIQETIDDMGLILTFDDGESGFLGDEDGLLNLLHESEMADVLQFIEGYGEPYDFPSEDVDYDDHFIVLGLKEHVEFVTRIGWSSDLTSNQYLVKTAKRVKKITSIKINGVDMVRREGEGD